MNLTEGTATSPGPEMWQHTQQIHDIWAAGVDADGYVIVVFISPSGLGLGTVKAPAEFAITRMDRE